MSLKSRERNFRFILRALSVAAIVVGVLSLLGVRPMNSRTVEVVLGTASLLAGIALFALLMRSKPESRTISVA
jgi:uncharacterized membrane protein HdeD (DUF308 family)